MVANRILLADDHAIVRQGLKALLEREGFAVVAEADDGQAAVRHARERCPDVAVLDFSMPLLNGLDAALEILRACPRAKAILLTMHTDDHYVLSALQAGVKGYVVKTQASSDLVRAVLQLVAEGKSTKEVAGLLGISFKTAESHRTRILKKLDLHETAGLVRYAVRRGLIQA